MAKIVIDPITRIEGHLRIEAAVEGGRVQDAWSSSTMYRGIEKILQGRDPRDAWYFTQRFCGVCTTVHSIASIRAVENALDLATSPPGSRRTRPRQRRSPRPSPTGRSTPLPISKGCRKS